MVRGKKREKRQDIAQGGGKGENFKKGEKGSGKAEREESRRRRKERTKVSTVRHKGVESRRKKKKPDQCIISPASQEQTAPADVDAWLLGFK